MWRFNLKCTKMYLNPKLARENSNERKHCITLHHLNGIFNLSLLCVWNMDHEKKNKLQFLLPATTSLNWNNTLQMQYIKNAPFLPRERLHNYQKTKLKIKKRGCENCYYWIFKFSSIFHYYAIIAVLAERRTKNV